MSYEVRDRRRCAGRAQVRSRRPARLSNAVRPWLRTSALRKRGYPAPHYLRTGRAGSVGYGFRANCCPAQPLATAALELFPACRRSSISSRRGPAGATPVAGRHRRRVSPRGGPATANTTRCAAYSPETRALLDRVLRDRRCGHRRRRARRRRRALGLEHLEHPSADGRRITGVFDWEGSTCGDAPSTSSPTRCTRMTRAAATRCSTWHAARTDPRALAALRRAHGPAPGRLVDPLPRGARGAVVRSTSGTALLDAAGAG